ncbi:hypothetical protein B0H63DRAFT_140891 [Podospora didyma]|uniref:Uncharacterized protein n=1 Tax=Podospora didyma TaxID=330526 RepID=A0AAE0U0W0_9PEZI|nr:hypothetical protein B0H63DRAFT_140891 [Podospora didyma]
MRQAERAVSAYFGAFAIFAQGVLASPSTFPSAIKSRTVPACVDSETIPNLWSVQELSVTYTDDELVSQGNASFILSNHVTRYTESLRCSLRANYVCEFHGTPGDKDLEIWVQLNLQLASITISEPWACDAGSSGVSAHVVGTAEVMLVCPENVERGLTCHSDGDPDYNGMADGSVVLTSPPSKKRAAWLETQSKNARDLKLKSKGGLKKRGNVKVQKQAATTRRGHAAAFAAGRRGGQSRANDGGASLKAARHDHKVEDADKGRADLARLKILDLTEKHRRAAIEEHKRCSPSCRGGAWSKGGARRTLPVLPVFLEER